MLTTATTSTAYTTYDRSGKTGALFRSEPAQPIANVFDQGSTTTEKYKDKVSLSSDGLDKSRRETTAGEGNNQSDETASPGNEKLDDGQKSQTEEITEVEEKMVRQLKERDQEVKAHEMAHLVSAGQYASGGPSYSYQQGPDGRRYAVGGEVPIDIGKEQTPEETIQKMQIVKRAAMAPANPSSADRSIAANAASTENQARRELQNERANPERERSGSADAAQSEEAPQATSDETASSSRSRHHLLQDVFA
jgi:hypothetical protein